MNKNQSFASFSGSASEFQIEPIEDVRDKMANAALFASWIVAFFALAASLLRAMVIGWQDIMFLHIGVFVIALTPIIFLRRLSYHTRAFIIPGILFICGAVGLFKLGLIGLGLPTLMTGCILVSIFFGSRFGFAALAGSLVIIAVTAVAAQRGLIEFKIDMSAYAVSPFSWTLAALSSVYYTGLLVATLGRLHSYLVDSISFLNKRTSDLQRTNEQLNSEISNRKQAEEALQKSGEQYRLLAENIEDVIWRSGLNFDWEYFSPSFERLTGFSHEEALKMPLERLLTPASYEKVINIYQEVMDSAKGRNSEYVSRKIEVEHNHKDGSTVWAEVNVKLQFDGDGNPRGFYGVTRNISDRKLAEEKKMELEAQLQQSQKLEAIGTLAGGIAHDFNNILAAVFGYTELAMDHAEKNSVLEDHLHEVLTAAQRAKDLVQQILTYSRQSEQELKPVQINLILKEALKLLRASLPTTVEIRQSFKSESLVMSDTTQIHRILMNLCTNAGYAMQEKGGVLAVELEDVELDPEFAAAHQEIEPGPYVQLTVSDTGHGMAKEVMDRIFDPFYTTKEQGEGTGMGLSVVHGIVKSYGGTISVYSEPGNGSTFRVFFPTIERRLDREGRVEKPIPKGTECILFVDDELSLVNLGKQILESLGYKVITRTSSIEAMGLFKDRPEAFDLVITDMTMPNMPGDELSKNLMAIRPDIPILLCTGFSASITEEKAKNIGVRGLVSKPILKRDLAETIRKVLDEK